MNSDRLSSPYDIVATALNCPSESLTEDSGMLNHPNWDSVSHVGIIVEIEEKYKITIPDEDVMKYDNMKAIIELFNNLKESPSDQ